MGNCHSKSAASKGGVCKIEEVEFQKVNIDSVDEIFATGQDLQNKIAGANNNVVLKFNNLKKAMDIYVDLKKDAAIKAELKEDEDKYVVHAAKYLVAAAIRIDFNIPEDQDPCAKPKELNDVLRALIAVQQSLRASLETLQGMDADVQGFAGQVAGVDASGVTSQITESATSNPMQGLKDAKTFAKNLKSCQELPKVIKGTIQTDQHLLAQLSEVARQAGA